MPKKVVDEDRLRRKAALEAKKLARKEAKDKEEALNKQTNDETLRQQSQGQTADDPKEEAIIQPATGTCPLFTIPHVSMCTIYSMLCAADLGCLASTCRRLNSELAKSRVSYLLSRLKNPPRHHFCDSKVEAEALVEQSLVAGGDTGRIVAKKKKDTQFHDSNQFPAYARFLEEAVTGYSTLATGNRKDPVLLPSFIQGRFLSCSPEHSLIRCGGADSIHGAGGSSIASWGVGKRGQLGHGKRKDERLPKRMVGIDRIRIVQVSAGGGLVRVAHSLLLTSTGRVLSFGTGQYGALGHGFSAAKQLPDCLRPTPIAGLPGRCIAVSAGELHSAAVTEDGDVYTWGDGFCGQLGHGDKRPQVLPVQVTKGGLDDECVTNISCGSRHTLAVTEDGDCFSWGLGHFGVLGRCYTPFEYDADTAVENFAGDGNNEEIVGGQQALIIPERVVVERAPRDAAAELAAHLDLIANLSLDDSSDQCVPKVIDSLKGIKLIGASAGHRHSLLLDDHGAVYSCGAGSGGALGHRDKLSQMFPCRVTFFDDQQIRIQQMSAGVDISMVVASTGEVYSWGKTDNGRIGLGMSKGCVTIPTIVPLDDSVKAIDVECGYVHSLVLGVDGTVHVCGSVGVDGESDGLRQNAQDIGKARLVPDMNVWHRVPEATSEPVQKPVRQKYGKYEVKGRSKMLNKDG